MARTYSPLPGWPIAAGALALFLAPGYRPRTVIGALVGGYVVGPIAAHLIHLATTVDDAIVELPHEGDTP